MKLLLDTHVFLWYISADPQLPVAFRDAIRDPGNEVFLSVASVWETVIKHALGKLPLPQAPATYLPAQREAHRISSLVIDEGALEHLAKLPALHRDPFDRMLISQAIAGSLAIVTPDPLISQYPVRVIW